MILLRLGIVALVVVLVPLRAPGQAPAPRGMLVEKPWEKLSHRRLMEYGEKALGADPHKWKHGETEHFVFHFQELADAQLVGELAEAYYRQIQIDLGVTQDRLTRKNHVFIFNDRDEWQRFFKTTRLDGGAVGIASRTELFLLSPGGSRFATGVLGHEITHCIFYRFVPNPVPLWLNEGFAEFESFHVYAKLRGLDETRYGSRRAVHYPLKQLLSATKYPKEEVSKFYAASERLVRFLLTEQDRRKFLPFVQMVASGAKSEDALLFIYHDQFKSFAEFAAVFEKFNQPPARRNEP
ncbi:MAG: hypothetical protein A2107_15205 [Verrucomicrobia bacterium GWF2_62_7]|nr:MAG: hypothetical protein A2107_15205 [Verrucomicrobia bacterium GWF2_62_7]